MPITPAQIQAAKAIQDAAAYDQAAQVRLIAGPGTGKSFSIEERVRWLLAQGVPAAGIAVVSFTRASSIDLRNRIGTYCVANNQPTGADVRVSTLHSLALRMLRAAGLLQYYPADPLVLDTWELEEVFDAEFGYVEGIGKKRQDQIRREHEAFWSTGQWAPPNYIPPDPPITAAERASFLAYHGPRTQTYSCVLPGEIVRQCVQQITAGALDPVGLLHLQHLIVDEYQDLNPADQQLISEIIARGMPAFVAGDDDQSIYSFRYGSPSGIQNFTQQYPGAGSRVLSACFRCTPAIVTAATSLITSYPPQNRVAKNLVSLYEAAEPALQGTVHRWRFATAASESDAVASSCKALIDAGLNPRDILILLSKQRDILRGLSNALTAQDVPFEPPRSETFVDLPAGRFVLGLIRILCDPTDYVAHRLILGLPTGIGIGTANGIAAAVIDNALNYRDLFYNALPAGIFTGRQLTALNRARAVCGAVAQWQAGDTLAQRSPDVGALLTTAFGQNATQSWTAYIQSLPVLMSLAELRDWLWADNDEQQMNVLTSVYARLNQPVPQAAVLLPRVRIMTMHGAKGLSSRVCFVPCLEESLFPGPKRQPYPGLVLEAARLLYVSITRARASCVLSYSRRRVVQGQSVAMAPSRFTASTGGAFVNRTVGLQPQEVQQIMNEIAQL